MGTRSNQDIVQIGEIELEKEASLKGRLLCSSQENTTLSIIIQNEVGASKYQNNFDLIEGEQELLLDLSQLKPGGYHAWIEANGQTFIRAIQVSKDLVNDKKGIFETIKVFFQF